MKSLSRLRCSPSSAVPPTPDILLVGHLQSERRFVGGAGARLSVDSLNRDEANRPLARRVHVDHAETGKNLEELHAQAVRVATVNRRSSSSAGFAPTRRVTSATRCRPTRSSPSPGAGHPGPKPNPYLFCLGLSPAGQAKSLVSFAKEKGKRLLLVTSKQSPEAIAQAIRNEVKSTADLELREVVIPGDPGWQLALEPTLGQTDVVFLCLDAAERTKAVSDSLLSKIPASGVAILAGDEIDNLASPGGENLFTLATYPNSPEEAKKPFIEAYTKEYKSPPDIRALMMGAMPSRLRSLQAGRVRPDEEDGREMHQEGCPLRHADRTNSVSPRRHLFASPLARRVEGRRVEARQEVRVIPLRTPRSPGRHPRCKLVNHPGLSFRIPTSGSDLLPIFTIAALPPRRARV